MAKRILPYRDYSEHDVVNAFSLDLDGAGITGAIQGSAGDHDAGVIVAVSADSTLPGDMPTQDTGGALRSYLGASYNASTTHIGYSSYPYNGMTVEPADSGDTPLGITLRETLAFDENGEKMLYYPVKLDEAQAVLPGHSVPVLTRGLVLLSTSAFENAGDAGIEAGGKLAVSATAAGKFAVAESDSTVVGTILSVGKESTSADGAVDKVLCKISF